MKHELIKALAIMAACVLAGVQSQASSTSTNSGSIFNSSKADSSSGISGASSGIGSSHNQDMNSSQMESSGRLTPTGRPSGMAHNEAIRASRLTGSEVKSSTGSNLGMINDVLINPTSGKVDFAVLQLSASAGMSETAPGTTTSSSPMGASSGKLVAVPWSLIKAAPESAAPATSPLGTMNQRMTFTFRGDQAKLASAPSFSPANWPDTSQASWRQSVYSHFGVSGSSAMGASEGEYEPSSTGESSSKPGDEPKDDSSDK